MAGRLTAKQRQFIDEYIRTGHATRSALAAACDKVRRGKTVFVREEDAGGGAGRSAGRGGGWQS
jgi:hypothetical protein